MNNKTNNNNLLSINNVNGERLQTKLHNWSNYRNDDIRSLKNKLFNKEGGR